MKKYDFIRTILIFFIVTEFLFLIILQYFILYPALGASFKQTINEAWVVCLNASGFIIGFGMIFFMIAKPIAVVIDKKNRGTALTQSDMLPILKAEKLLFITFIASNIIGYILGTVIQIFVIRYTIDSFVRYPAVRFMISLWTFGLPMGILQSLFVSYRLQKVKIFTQITEFEYQKGQLDFTKKFLLLFSGLLAYIIIFFCLFSISRESQIAGLYNIAFSKDKTYQESNFGYFSPLLETALTSDDDRVREEAIKITQSWRQVSIDHLRYIFSIGFFILIIAFVFIYVFVKDIASNMQTLIAKLKNIIRLEGDLSQFLVRTENTDIGEIQVLINQLILNLNKILKNIYATTQNIMGALDEGKIRLNDLLLSNSQVQDKSHILNQELIQQNDITRNTSALVKEVIQLISHSIGQITNQSVMIGQSSTAVTELAASIQSVSATTEKAAYLSDQLSVVAIDGKTVIINMKESIDEISITGSGINDMVNTISSIADQTDLLAMNAAIEAAHAGDAGKGFAVVADEIRKLAENSAGQTRDITVLLKAMDDMIGNAVTKSVKMSESMNNIQNNIQSTINLIQEINSAAKEQSCNADNNMQAVQLLLETNAKVMKNLDEQKNKNDLLTQSIGKMEQSTLAMDKIRSSNEDYFQKLAHQFELFHNNFNQINTQLKTLAEKLALIKFADEAVE